MPQLQFSFIKSLGKVILIHYIFYVIGIYCANTYHELRFPSEYNFIGFTYLTLFVLSLLLYIEFSMNTVTKNIVYTLLICLLVSLFIYSAVYSHGSSLEVFCELMQAYTSLFLPIALVIYDAVFHNLDSDIYYLVYCVYCIAINVLYLIALSFIHVKFTKYLG